MRTAIILGLGLICLLLLIQGFRLLWRALFPVDEGESPPPSFLSTHWGRLLLLVLLGLFLIMGYQELGDEQEDPSKLHYRPAIWKDGQLIPGGFEPIPPAKTP